MTEDPTDSEPLTSMHVRRAVGGDGDSLAWLVGRLSPLLVMQASYRLGQRLRRVYEPEDLVHEAWLAALPKLGGLRERDGRLTPVLLRFLSTALLFKINNLIRKHARRGPITMSAEGTGTLDEVPDPRSGIVTMAMRREVQNTVRACIDKLDAKDREILLLRGIEQQANNTVAVILQMKPQTVAMRYKRALEKLRALLPHSVFDELEDE